VRVIRQMSHNGRTYAPGESIDMPLDEARRIPWAVDTGEPGITAPVGPEVAPDEEPEPSLRADGPTFETFVAAGYPPEGYPPHGFAEVPSPGLDAYRVGQEPAGDSIAPEVAGEIDDHSEADALALIAAIADVDALVEAEAAEQARADGGRAAVLAAIDERFEALAAGMAGEGPETSAESGE